MLVDDDCFERKLFDFIVPHMPFEVSTLPFATCEEMLATLSQSTSHPDLILIEQKMPGMTGVECITFLKQKAAYRGIKVALFTNNAHDVTIKDAVAAGVDYYILKPHDLNKTMQVLEWLLLHKRNNGKPVVICQEDEDGVISYQAA